MRDLLSQLPHNGADIVLRQEVQNLTLSAVKSHVARLEKFLGDLSGNGVAMMIDNSISWILCDLALSASNKVSIPIPHFFSTSQVQHTLSLTAAKWLIADTQLENYALVSKVSVGGQVLFLYDTNLQGDECYFPNTKKVTFTSGSTGAPKGVCLSLPNQLAVAKSLCEVISLPQPKHLCLLPLPVLLENIAGVYAPLLSGGCVEVAALSSLGFEGSRLANPSLLLNKISQAKPTSLILVPELLLVLIQAVQKGWLPPSSLKFIAVGGAKVDVSVLQQAVQLGLPVFQGYGLSEAGSVVCLNVGQQDGSVGKLLPHLTAKVEDGELHIKGNPFLGYLKGESLSQNGWLATGDLVSHQDAQYFIEGRKSNLIITSFGRNVSPEWPESLLLAEAGIMQCVVIGEAKPFLTALIVSGPNFSEQLLEQAVARVNKQLPDYAQIKKTLLLEVPFTQRNGLLTSNGRPKRKAISECYHLQIANLYVDANKAIA
ncbi:AMP-binding protein (plasmid) [Pseudoalteromonas sp. T1lg65]|uniref:AMP-binding protein n=1 Tax=Pseudoalteromonas sp. T1lg65 TaxID=2077101 RepID=UPI003F799413